MEKIDQSHLYNKKYACNIEKPETGKIYLQYTYTYVHVYILKKELLPKNYKQRRHKTQ